jgi:S1-C subfamily serine protease
MFDGACALYTPCLCQIFGVLPNDQIAVIGSGCLLGPDRLITARHVVEDTQSAGGSLRVWKTDGSFEAKVIWNDMSSDLAILRTTKCLQPSGQAQPTTYPQIASVLLAQGMLLGYMATLRRTGGAVKNNRYFASGFVSFLNHHTDKAVRYVLASGFIEGGFSGGPVFLPDNSLIGVLVSSCEFTSEILGVTIPHAFPEAVALAIHRPAISSALAAP